MNAADLSTRTWHQGTYGNLAHEKIDFRMANGDNIGSTHDGAIVPEGILLIDAFIVVTDASNATVTANIGVKSVSGTNQDSVNFFFATQALSALAMARRSSAAAPLLTQQPMYVRLTVAGANITEATLAELHVIYKNVGTR